MVILLIVFFLSALGLAVRIHDREEINIVTVLHSPLYGAFMLALFICFSVIAFIHLLKQIPLWKPSEEERAEQEKRDWKLS